MCPPPRNITTINQLIKTDNSSINYSGEANIVLTIGTTFSTVLFKMFLHILQGLLTNPFQNLENVDIACIFFANEFSFYYFFTLLTLSFFFFQLSTFQTFPTHPPFETFPPFSHTTPS